MEYSKCMQQIVKILISNNTELIEEGILYAFLLVDGNKITVKANDNGITAAWKRKEDIRKEDCR